MVTHSAVVSVFLDHIADNTTKNDLIELQLGAFFALLLPFTHFLKRPPKNCWIQKKWEHFDFCSAIKCIYCHLFMGSAFFVRKKRATFKNFKCPPRYVLTESGRYSFLSYFRRFPCFDFFIVRAITTRKDSSKIMNPLSRFMKCFLPEQKKSHATRWGNLM